MAINDEGTGSFDPRTWASGSSATPAMPISVASPPRTDSASFDFKTWGGGGGAAPAPVVPPPPIVDQAETKGGMGKTWLLAGAAGLAILGIGAAIAIGVRQPAAPPTANPTPAEVPIDSAVPVATASRRTLNVSSPEAIADALESAGIAPGEARTATALVMKALAADTGEIRLAFDLSGAPGSAQLLAFAATRDDGSGITLKRDSAGGFHSEAMAAHLTTRLHVVRGEMDADSFYSSAVSAGITDSLISDFANAFSFDFNFATDIKPGDVFEGAFEQAVNPGGDPVGAPRLVYVSMTTTAKSRSLYRFLAPGDTAPSWFDGNGNSTVRALMRTPVDGARISSKFGPRFHPVLHFIKVHKGTDFAAPTGTPIYASGNAQVVFAAMKGANGNLTVLRHDNGWQTLYLHQSAFMPGIAPGARVSQGQKIGEVGTTGRSTGPHLHYEVHIGGVPVDPMSIDTGTGKSLSGAGQAAFAKERDRIDTQRAGGGIQGESGGE